MFQYDICFKMPSNTLSKIWRPRKTYKGAKLTTGKSTYVNFFKKKIESDQMRSSDYWKKNSRYQHHSWLKSITLTSILMRILARIHSGICVDIFLIRFVWGRSASNPILLFTRVVTDWSYLPIYLINKNKICK